jgi:hypothetical protein
MLALLLLAEQSFGIAGVWRRHARRWAVVGTTVAVSEASKSSAQTQQADTAAAQSAAAASQASAAAAESAAAASRAAAAPAAAAKTPQQKLEELESLYKQGLISESDYNAAKAKILAQLTQ